MIAFKKRTDAFIRLRWSGRMAIDTRGISANGSHRGLQKIRPQSNFGLLTSEVIFQTDSLQQLLVVGDPLEVLLKTLAATR